MRQITCPVCNSTPTFLPEPNSLCTCQTCGIKWTYLPEEVQLEDLYEDEVYAVVDNRQSVFEKIIFAEARKILRIAENLHSGDKRLLDFGCGKGQFLKVANELCWDGEGIETAPERAKFAREKYGLKVLEEFYSHGKINKGNFDLLTLNHVLEHLPKPMGLLSELLTQNLSDQGIFYVEVPRADSWQAKIAGRHWIHWDIPKHLTHWTESVLIKQMENIGFQKVSTRSFSLHLGVLGMLQALLIRLGYRQNLILRLKRKKTVGMMLAIGIVLPFAVILEVLSLPFGKSGILGVYFQKNA